MARTAESSGLRVAALMVIGLLAGAAAAAAQQEESIDPPRAGRAAPAGAKDRAATKDYVVGPRDVLAITVWDQPNLSGKFNVDADGMFAFPLVGRVPAAGLTPAAIEGSVAKRLADGFLANPTVTVNVEEYKSQRIFVVGEVRQPGPYPLTGRMTLIEMLALVRSTTAEASKQAIVVRPRHVDAATGPTLPAPGSDVAAEVMKINLQALETGDLSNNIELRDGDTIFVPRAETVVVFGQVRSPGVYPISPTTTIVQLLAQAGGVTDRGAANRIKIVRMTNGRKREFTAKLDDLVNAGDTIIIPDRLF